MVKYRNMCHRLHENSVLDANGCHVWTGSLQKNGYGRINIRLPVNGDGCRGKHVQLRPHRVSFEEKVRKLESWEEVDHICGNRACINTDHHQAVSHKVNMQLMFEQKKTTNIGGRIFDAYENYNIEDF